MTNPVQRNKLIYIIFKEEFIQMKELLRERASSSITVDETGMKIKTIPNTTPFTEMKNQFYALMGLWSKVVAENPRDYSEGQVRKSEWNPPAGYTFSRFCENGINFEILQPKNNQSENVIFMVHGGSFVYRMHDGFISLMPAYAKAANATVVSVDYRCAPEYTYEDMIHDVVGAYNWLLTHGYKPSNIIACGDSSGGGTLLASMLYLRDHGYELPAGIITMSAVTNMNCNTPSWTTHRDEDITFGGDTPLLGNIAQLVKDNDPYNPYLSPYYGDFYNFPPMLIQAASGEVLLDDSTHIAYKASTQGVDVTLEIYEKMFHDFQNMHGTLAEADIAWENVAAFTSRIFNASAGNQYSESDSFLVS